VTTHDRFPTRIDGLPASVRSEVMELSDRDAFALRIAPVAKRIGDATVRMLAYNGSIPGPTLRVRQGSQPVVDVTNDGDLETTVHWHGLRLENRYDGTHETQGPIPIGGTFSYRLQCPDPGVYWYHPHIREDYGQELGLYGNILVVPNDPDYWAPVNREVALTLDDILIEGGEVAPFRRSETTHVAMGRFGNILLAGGELEPEMTARPGEVVRFYLTNTANTRLFNLGLQGARMKLVGGDGGRCEHEEFVSEVLLAPSERVVLDVLLDQPGRATLVHRTPDRTSLLATIIVSGDRAAPSFAEQFNVTRTHAELVAERARISPLLATPPDRILAFVAEMNMGTAPGASVYTCPMHPEVTSAEQGRCPHCGMKLVPAAPDYDGGMHGGHHATHPQPGGTHAHDSVAHTHHHGTHEHGRERGLEWEDDMVEVNRMTTPANMIWKIVDRTTGAENHAIDWRFRVGDRVKIRLVNQTDSDHPMPHPFHVHGAGRFLILSRDGVDEPNLVWKDTVLVRTGETVDILLDVTNPGVWMAHCHIAEHHEGGMMFTFRVDPTSAKA
jgi:FtsP/CotA-like multicopper oxidase with cupredoxin domain